MQPCSRRLWPGGRRVDVTRQTIHRGISKQRQRTGCGPQDCDAISIPNRPGAAPPAGPPQPPPGACRQRAPRGSLLWGAGLGLSPPRTARCPGSPRRGGRHPCPPWAGGRGHRGPDGSTDPRAPHTPSGLRPAATASGKPPLHRCRRQPRPQAPPPHRRLQPLDPIGHGCQGCASFAVCVRRTPPLTPGRPLRPLPCPERGDLSPSPSTPAAMRASAAAGASREGGRAGASFTGGHFVLF
jgi:hypothetical protein